MCVVVLLHFFVCDPDRREASRLGRHNVDTVTEVDRQILHAGACKFEHFVFHKAVLKHSLYQRDGYIVRTYTLAGSAFEPNQNYFGCVDIPSVAKQLLHEFAAAFADAHITERSVARVAVRT